MDINALKLCAERVRAHLETHQITLNHSQALDLIAAIPGLRNWPEVGSFPDKVAAAELDDQTADRLARRIAKQHSVIVPASELLQALAGRSVLALKIWPDGPVPGVYVTTSARAIEAAVKRYEAATDGALLYAENDGSTSGFAIDLGEGGLFSKGMEKLPSGTLIVVGPMELTQEAWEESWARMNVAANLALSHSLRIVVLAVTPLPANLHSDIDLLLRSDEDGVVDDMSLDNLGVVTAKGDLHIVAPFVASRVRPAAKVMSTTDQKLPFELERALREALKTRPFGILLFGISPFSAPGRMNMLDALLPLTDHAGPAVRIQDHFRSSDKPLAPAIDALPVFPSVESAYAHGYRRIVVTSTYSQAFSIMQKYANDACFLVLTRDAGVSGMWVRSGSGREESTDHLKVTIAAMSVADIAARDATYLVCDAITSGEIAEGTDEQLEELFPFFEAKRAIRWEDQLEDLLTAGKVTAAEAKNGLRLHEVEGYLASRRKGRTG